MSIALSISTITEEEDELPVTAYKLDITRVSYEELGSFYLRLKSLIREIERTIDSYLEDEQEDEEDESESEEE